MRKNIIKILFFLDILEDIAYINCTLRRGVEQLAARRAHNPEAAGSSPAPAIKVLAFWLEPFFILNKILFY